MKNRMIAAMGAALALACVTAASWVAYADQPGATPPTVSPTIAAERRYLAAVQQAISHIDAQANVVQNDIKFLETRLMWQRKLMRSEVRLATDIAARTKAAQAYQTAALEYQLRIQKRVEVDAMPLDVATAAVYATEADAWVERIKAGERLAGDD